MFKYFLLLNALVISSIAAYYSILGLVVIFAASAVPVIVMASALEVGKVVTTTYLHNHWKETGWVLKTYLTLAVAILMIITSLGIFGFLSKAHIEQGLGGVQTTQLIEQIDRQIESLEADEEASLLSANERIQSLTEQTNSEIEVINTQIRATQRNLDAIALAKQTNDVIQLQTLVGVETDGRFGPDTEQAVQTYTLREEIKVDELNARVQELNNRLQEQIENIETIDVTEQVDQLIQERFELERRMIELEAEIGPIKYVAEMVYGESNEQIIEKSVRWMIIVIVTVFDPLAIALLLAFNTLNHKGKENDSKTYEPVQKTTSSGRKENEHKENTDQEENFYKETENDSEEFEKGLKQITSVREINSTKRRGKVAKGRKLL